jgi:hypothetical protein
MEGESHANAGKFAMSFTQKNRIPNDAKAKRRSFLPQLGQATSSARPNAPAEGSSKTGSKMPVTESSDSTNAAAYTHKFKMPEPKAGRLRPKSMYQTGTNPSEASIASTASTVTRSMRPPSIISRSSELQQSSVGRSQSLRKPAVQGQSVRPAGSISHLRNQSASNAPAAQAHSVRPAGSVSHLRNQSSSTVSALRRDAAGSKSTAERPKSMLLAPSSSSKTSSGPTESRSIGTRISARLAGLGRSSSVKSKSEAASSAAASKMANKVEEPMTSQSKRKEPTKEEPKKGGLRPAFSTLQQHFTPKKTNKAPTSSFLHPAPVSGTNIPPPEVVSLQSELLQLSLLHENSEQVARQWEQSAKRILHHKFDEVASLHHVALEQERAGQEQKNLQALLEWSGNSPSAGLVEHIQILSGPLHELPSLVEPGGRVWRLVDTFSRWLSWVEEIRTARQCGTGDESDPRPISGLNDSWKAENAALVRKLTSFSRDLDNVDQPAQGSSIFCIVDSCQSLLKGLLDELHTMQAIEIDTVAKEKDWVESQLHTIAKGAGIRLIDMSSENAAWRM